MSAHQTSSKWRGSCLLIPGMLRMFSLSYFFSTRMFACVPFSSSVGGNVASVVLKPDGQEDLFCLFIFYLEGFKPFSERPSLGRTRKVSDVEECNRGRYSVGTT